MADSLYSYGHSYTAYPSAYATQYYGEYQLRIGRDLGIPLVISRGRRATPLVDTISAIIAPTFVGVPGKTWEVGTTNGTKAVMWHDMMNDVSKPEGCDVDYFESYKLALRLGLGVFGSRKCIQSSANTVGGYGTWTPYTSDLVAGGLMHSSRDYGAKMNFVVSGDSCHISTLVCSTEYDYGTMRIDVNGVSTGIYFNGTGKMRARNDTLDGRYRIWQPAGIRVTGMNTIAGTTGDKTLTIRRVEPFGSIKPIFVNAVYLTTSAPPKVYIALEPPRNPGGVNAEAITAFYANQEQYRWLIQAVANEYSYVTCVDLAPGWDNSTMVAITDTESRFHPNDLGMQSIADRFKEVM